VNPPSRRRFVFPKRKRLSLRSRVAIAIVATALAPLLLVYTWSSFDSPLRDRTARHVVDAVDAVRSGPLDDATIAHIARDERVRLRTIDSNRAMRADVDADRPWDAFNPIEAFLLHDESRPDGRDLDRRLGGFESRTVVRTARATGRAFGCRLVPVYACESAILRDDGILVHAQASSYRPVEAIEALRHQLGRIAFVVVPLAILLALYTAERVARPIEHLRREALAQLSAERPTFSPVEALPDEVTVLARSFDSLLVTLDEKRRENQAFVADLVHEVKNPIAAIRAVAEGLESRLPDADRAARYCRALEDCTTKLDRLVSQFLELARADAGLPDEERSRVELVPLLEALAARLANDPRHAGLVVERRFEARESEIVGVAFRIESMFGELLANAASFAGESGRVAIGLRLEGRDVVVAISDSGPGIAEADLDRVFERFFTTRGARRGTGLGLALVRSVVLAHGGSISVRNDAGAVFEVRLPAA